MAKGYVYRADRPNTPYRVIMYINKCKTYIGSFKTAEEATEAYKMARAEHPELPKNGGRKKGSKYTYKPKPPKPRVVRSLNMARWTLEEKETLKNLYYKTELCCREIGLILGRTEKSIYCMIQRIIKSN